MFVRGFDKSVSQTFQNKVTRSSWRAPHSGRNAVSTSSQQEKLVVTSLPAPRRAAPPPQPLPVQHSPSYLLRNRRSTVEPARTLVKNSEEEPFNGSALEWALRRVDAQLDEVEENPPQAAKALWDVARGPVGTATAKGVTAAAQVTVLLGTEALKAAAPVGKWAVTQGFKAAVGLAKSAASPPKKGKK